MLLNHPLRDVRVTEATVAFTLENGTIVAFEAIAEGKLQVQVSRLVTEVLEI